MRRSILAGHKELLDAQGRVGMIVGASAQLEQAIVYLQWQLVAFSLDAENPSRSEAERQTALRLEHTEWDKFAPLSARLNSATRAFGNPAITSRVNSDPRLQELRGQWDDLSRRVGDVAKERNAVAHTYLCWHESKVKRQVGQPWDERIVVSAEEDQALAVTIGSLVREVGLFTTELGELLPFADNRQIHTIA
jgi:hypothetical protein